MERYVSIPNFKVNNILKRSLYNRCLSLSIILFLIDEEREVKYVFNNDKWIKYVNPIVILTEKSSILIYNRVKYNTIHPDDYLYVMRKYNITKLLLLRELCHLHLLIDIFPLLFNLSD